MVGAGHVSAQCQETQPLHSSLSPAPHFPCIVLHLYCIAQCKSRNLYTRAKPYTSLCILLSKLPLHCSASGQRRPAHVLFNCIPLLATGCNICCFPISLECNMLLHCEAEAWVAAAPNIRFQLLDETFPHCDPVPANLNQGDNCNNCIGVVTI